MRQQLGIAMRILAVFTLLTGLLYPMVVTGLAQLVFPAQANGSVLRANGTAVGSALIGQPFTAEKYLWGRPSATTPFADNAAASTGSNLGPSNPALVDAVRARIARLRQADPQNGAAIPTDLVTTSASGLDPDITLAAANYQVARVARTRGLTDADIAAAIAPCTREPLLGIIGTARVNVLCVNLALDHVPVQP